MSTFFFCGRDRHWLPGAVLTLVIFFLVLCELLSAQVTTAQKAWRVKYEGGSIPLNSGTPLRMNIAEERVKFDSEQGTRLEIPLLQINEFSFVSPGCGPVSRYFFAWTDGDMPAPFPFSLVARIIADLACDFRSSNIHRFVIGWKDGEVERKVTVRLNSEDVYDIQEEWSRVWCKVVIPAQYEEMFGKNHSIPLPSCEVSAPPEPKIVGPAPWLSACTSPATTPRQAEGSMVTICFDERGAGEIHPPPARRAQRLAAHPAQLPE